MIFSMEFFNTVFHLFIQNTFYGRRTETRANIHTRTQTQFIPKNNLTDERAMVASHEFCDFNMMQPILKLYFLTETVH